MILLDVSTMYQFRHWRPMGILRVEREVFKAFQDGTGAQVCAAIFNQEEQAFYRLPADILEALVAGSDLCQERSPRLETAPTGWRSFLRIGRFLFQARRRSRAIKGDDSRAHRHREKVLGEELLRLSLEEFSLLVNGLRRIGKIMPRYRFRAAQFEDINHRVHYGLMNNLDDDICVPANRINPQQVSHYVSAGSFWTDDRFRVAYEMKQAHGWTLHYCIYDLVPINWGHLAEPTTRKTFPHALHWLLWGADQIWTISETSKRDILELMASCGYPQMAPERIRPVYLGSEMAHSGLTPEEEAAFFAEHGLEPGKFVLMVGTLEPRKNHDFAYRLWREMAQQSPDKVMPLVWAGQPGWLVEPMLEMLRNDYRLPHGTIQVLSDVPDAQLASLYKACRFTICPSHFEGWGLPVVESLDYGKPCLTSTATALLEAGAGCSEPIDLFDGTAWLERCQELMCDDQAYEQACAKAAEFSGFSWSQFRKEVFREFRKWQAETTLSAAKEHE